MLKISTDLYNPFPTEVNSSISTFLKCVHVQFSVFNLKLSSSFFLFYLFCISEWVHLQVREVLVLQLLAVTQADSGCAGAQVNEWICCTAALYPPMLMWSS